MDIFYRQVVNWVYNKTMNTIKLKKGFTLVELLVVIAIIGILATLLLLQLNVARAKARDTKRIGDVTQIRTAIELYYDSKGNYPAGITDALIGEFMATQKAPLDPTTGAVYGYGVDVATGKYQVWTQLEQQNANAFKTDADIPAGLPGGTNGASEAGVGGKCTAPGVGASDCVFDLGVN